MSIRDDLGNRMKEYEGRNQHYLQKRIPVILRLDMRAGHTFTKGFQEPFDYLFMDAMQETALYLCKEIQGSVMSYQQSDEITIVLQDYKTLETDPWFDYRTDKLCSIAASMATLYFNREFEKLYLEEISSYVYWDEDASGTKLQEDLPDYVFAHDLARKRGAMFDCRCFNIPLDEVTNLIYWRQLDATRNSIQMAGRAEFSHKELMNKSCNDIQEMLFQERNINWNDLSTAEKRGSCCVKAWDEKREQDKWIIDLDIPIFKRDGRQYIENRIKFE